MMKSRLLRNALIMSLVVHMFMLGSTFLLSDHLKPESKTVSIDFLSPADLEKMKAAEKLLDENQKQVVEQDSANGITPDEARFLSAKDQAVKKQTIATNKGDFQNAKNKAQQKSGAAQKAVQLAKEKSPPVPIKNLFSNYDPTESLARQQKQQKESVLPGSQAPEGAQGSAAVSQTNDYAKDVDKGLETLLNTREFKYYSYYTRIRRQLAQHWEGKVREKLSKMYREKRAPANVNEDRITKVIVVLNAAGTLVNVQILSDSGLRDLDDAAVEAFRAAAPFPNPPKGIIENDGTVKIRWDFVLES